MANGDDGPSFEDRVRLARWERAMRDAVSPGQTPGELLESLLSLLDEQKPRLGLESGASICKRLHGDDCGCWARGYAE